MMPHIVLCPPCLIDALLQVFILQLLGDEGMILLGKPDVCVNDTDVADHHSIVFPFLQPFPPEDAWRTLPRNAFWAFLSMHNRYFAFARWWGIIENIRT